MKRKNIETLIWIFCIILVSGMTVKVSSESTGYSCDKCSVILSNAQAYGQLYEAYEENVTKLIEAYKNGVCLYTWDPTQGYIINGR